MKKQALLFIVCVFAALSSALPSLTSFAIPHANAAARTVTVGIYENAPKVFTSESGEPSGIFVDIIKEIAKIEGWNLRFARGTWAEGLDRLAKGEIDLMPDVAYTAEREKIYSFHKVPVLSVWSQVYARRGSGIQSILDLNGKRIGALEQTIQLETFRKLVNSFGLKITLVPIPDYKTEFEMIAAGKIDAGLTNRFYGLMYARKFGLEDTPIMFDPAPFFFAAPNDAPRQLLDAIDHDLSEMKRDPHSAYYASMKRWTSEEVQLKLPAWLHVLGLVLGVVLVMSVAGSFLLKHQVSVRTRELKQTNQELAQRIAERKKAEEEAKLSSQLVHFLSKYANDFIILLDSDFRFIEINERVVDFYGYTREELIGMHASQLRPLETKEDFISQIKVVRDEGKAVYETIHQRKDGRIFPVEISLRAIDNEGKRFYQAIIRDITERKKADEELLKHRLHLEEMVNERTIELEAANEKLRELDQLKSMFIASMSHELRTPLNSIIGFTGILLQGLAGELNDEQRKQLGMVKGSAHHLLELITDIIDISKIETGKISLSIGVFDLSMVAGEVLDSFRPAAGRKSLELVIDTTGSLQVRSDERRIRQVLVNLIGNAVKFTPTGAVSVEVKSENGVARVAVRDTGPGIRAEDMDRLFRFFSQITSDAMPKHEGTGLGLYLSRKLMNLLGGDILVESEFGKGSVFTMILPLEGKG